MREVFHNVMPGADTLDEVFERMAGVFRAYDALQKFQYVSGVITSYGDVADNLSRMARRADAIRKILGGAAFAPTDVFPDALVHGLQTRHHYRHEHWMGFWTRVLCSGSVDAIIMTPGWERSRGADMEYAIGRNRGLAIYYYDDIVLNRME